MTKTKVKRKIRAYVSTRGQVEYHLLSTLKIIAYHRKGTEKRIKKIAKIELEEDIIKERDDPFVVEFIFVAVCIVHLFLGSPGLHGTTKEESIGRQEREKGTIFKQKTSLLLHVVVDCIGGSDNHSDTSTRTELLSRSLKVTSKNVHFVPCFFYKQAPGLATKNHGDSNSGPSQ